MKNKINKFVMNVITLFIKLFDNKGDNTMAVIYATLIVKGKKTLSQVPAIIRKDVEEILEALEVSI